MSGRLHSTIVLLLYLKFGLGQQSSANNGKGIQQQSLQWAPNNANQYPNGGININMAALPNMQPPNLQQSPNMSGSKQGNTQQALNLNNMQSQNPSQNNFQITKMSFTPVSTTVKGCPQNSCSNLQQTQNPGLPSNMQIVQSQNNQVSNVPSQISLSALAELMRQPSLLSLLSSQNGCQATQNQQNIAPNMFSSQPPLTEAQKQFLIRTLQQNAGQNQQINVVQAPPTMERQQAIAIQTIQGPPQQQSIAPPLASQPAYVTVQNQPSPPCVQQQKPVKTEEEPSILSLLLSELGSDLGYPISKKGSKPNIKTLIPLIINMLKDKNNCRNSCCPNNNGCPNTTPTIDPQMAQLFGMFSNQKNLGTEEPALPARIKKNDDEEARSNDKVKKEEPITKKAVSEESEEDDSEYVDDVDE